MLIDSHCHLDFPDFEKEVDAVVARAEAAGVGAIQTICTHVRRFERIPRGPAIQHQVMAVTSAARHRVRAVREFPRHALKGGGRFDPQ